MKRNVKVIVCLWFYLLFLLVCWPLAFAEGTDWICESCGAINTTNFCTQCGTKKPEGIVCSECGKIYPFDTEVQFCGDCGHKLPNGNNNSTFDEKSNKFTDESALFGMWTIKHYTDEFVKPTARMYITNEELIYGIFSNSATNNSNLAAEILIDDSGISIMLYEYGEYQVKTYSSTGDKYSIAVLDSDGRRHSLKGSMYSDRINVEYSNVDELLSVFANEGKMSFSITDENNGVNHYVFELEDTSGFIKAYYELTGTELISWNQQALAAKKSNEEKKLEQEREREKYENIIGQTVLLGSYEQDNNLENGKEPIEWIILKIDSGKAFLLSRYALDYKPYEKNEKTYMWEQSYIRRWLIGPFYKDAFNDEEKPILLDAEINDDKDKVIVLNANEIRRYKSDVLLCKPTKYAMGSNANHVNKDGNCTWLLRNVRIDKKVGVVTGEGKIDYMDQNNAYAVRPVVCADIDRLIVNNKLSTLLNE